MEKKNINEVIAELSVEQLAGMIDHTFLKPFGDASPIEKLCAEARQYQFAMVAINPAEVETCVKLLEGSGVRVGAAIGFPLGQNTVECKAFETRDAIAKGATEIDTVINVRALQKGQTEIVKKEIEDMVSICKPAGVICKVILETCYLTDEEKETVAELLPIIFLYVDLERSLFKKNDILFLQQFFFIFPTNPLRSRPTPYPTLSAIHHSPVWYRRQSTAILLRFLSLHLPKRKNKVSE